MKGLKRRGSIVRFGFLSSVTFMWTISSGRTDFNLRGLGGGGYLKDRIHRLKAIDQVEFNPIYRSEDFYSHFFGHVKFAAKSLQVLSIKI